MQRHASPPGARRSRALPALAFVLVAAVGMTACGSPSSSGGSLESITGTAIQQQCTNIADVLSDGPDPNADPVGYAEAQVLPLKQLKITNSKLHKAVDQLSEAYKVFSSTNGKATTEAVKVSKAEGEIDDLCPKGVGAQLLPGQAVP